MEWIPVSERLPEEGQEVLVTVWEDCSYGKGADIRTHVDMATFQTGGGYIPVDEKYSPDGGYFDTYNDWMEGQPCKILAWMPLPEPYKEEKNARRRRGNPMYPLRPPSGLFAQRAIHSSPERCQQINGQSW